MSLSIQQSESEPERVKLVCSDSGRGMSPDYFNSGLWSPFCQEDSMAEGTGLGLSIVQSIVKDMGGTIDVQSTQGVGTTFHVDIPLSPPARRPSKPLELPDLQTLERLQGSTYRLFGFDGSGFNDPRLRQSTSLIRTSIEKSLSGLGMSAQDTSDPQKDGQANVVIISEAEAVRFNKHGLPSGLHHSTFQEYCIVLCHSVTSSLALADSGIPWLSDAAFVSQPLGPRKLLKFFHEYLPRDSHLAASIASFKTPISKGRKPSSQHSKWGSRPWNPRKWSVGQRIKAGQRHHHGFAEAAESA